MATYLPKSMEFTEYKPSMQGIPVEAVARYYDRLDAEALRTDAAARATQTMLSKQLAAANEGDKPYLNDLFSKVEGVLDQAQQEKNLPGYAKQIRKLVGDIDSSPEFATVQENSRLGEETRRSYADLAKVWGPENVVTSGDNPSTFSSFNAEGGLQKFQGFATKRPDYLAGMDDVFMKNVDMVATASAMEEFVDNGTAFADYTKTPEGRVHINEVARDAFNLPFDRLEPPQAVEAVEKMNAILKDAGIRYIKTAKATAATPEMYKDLVGKSVIGSGVYGTSLTDGTDAADSTIQVFDDTVKGSLLDQQLNLLVDSDPTIPLYADASGGNTQINRGKGVQRDQIVGSRLTSAVGPTGYPLIQVEYNTQEGSDGERGMGYYELGPSDLARVSQEVSRGLMFQLRQPVTTPASRMSIAPAIANIFDPTFNKWDGAKSHTTYSPNGTGAGYEIKQVANGYAMYHLDGQPLMQGDKPVVFKTKNDVRGYVGMQIIGQY
jgi:hypothetical protein